MTRFEAKKSLGQHFLVNPKVADDIVAAAAFANGDTVLEVGPGTGALTEKLLAAGARVLAVEADGRAVAALRETFAKELESGALTLFHEDIRELPLASLPIREGEYAVVANIPYYISGQLFRLFLSHTLPKTIVFLVQKEVAERIARDPKESLLSLAVKAYGTPSYVRTVARGNFSPAPNVDSAVLKIGGISRTRFAGAGLDETRFFALVHAGFSSRRKQLFGNLKKLVPEAPLETAFARLGLPKTIRGEDLSIDDWTRLARVVQELST